MVCLLLVVLKPGKAEGMYLTLIFWENRAQEKRGQHFQLIFWSFIVFLKGFTEMGINNSQVPPIGRYQTPLKEAKNTPITNLNILNFDIFPITFTPMKQPLITFIFLHNMRHVYTIWKCTPVFKIILECFIMRMGGDTILGFFYKFLNMWFFHVFDKEIIIFHIFLLFLYFCHEFPCLWLL